LRRFERSSILFNNVSGAAEFYADNAVVAAIPEPSTWIVAVASLPAMAFFRKSLRPRAGASR